MTQPGLQRQITRLTTHLERYQRLSNRLSWARLWAFLGGFLGTLIAWINLGGGSGVVVLVTGVLAFGIAARQHRRVNQAITRHRIWLAIKEEHVARQQLDWSGLRAALFATPRAAFPVELDVDLTGDYGLHRLLDTCITFEGGARLRDWLVTTEPDPATVRARQALVRELARRPIFWDKLRMKATTSVRRSDQRWRGERLHQWISGVAPNNVTPAWLVYGLTGLALLNLVLFLLSVLAGLPGWWRVSSIIYVMAYLWRVMRMEDPFALALALRDPLHALHAVLSYLETYCYGQARALRALCTPILAEGQRPSVQLARITRVIAAASVRRNPPLWMLLSIVTPWDLHVTRWLDQRRAAIADLLPQWLDVWFELEALNALAALAYLKPAYTFPELVTDQPTAMLSAAVIGHPLIPDDQRVCNDFELEKPGEIVLITGSNMSGKSTFLRTLGVNLSLAYAGGPVNAARLRLVPLRLFTCIRITDSLTDGISYFYAEVKRLKALLHALADNHPYPVFFLIDEIFRGTNNQERLIGSRAYIQTLARQHGIGVISTHDLELVTLAEDIPHIRNLHFTEHIADGRMSFDYKLHAGPCPTTNALKIMRLEGLPVPMLEAGSEQ